MDTGGSIAFGLLGAFTLTCLSLDIVRHRERKAVRQMRNQGYLAGALRGYEHKPTTTSEPTESASAFVQEQLSLTEHVEVSDSLTEETPPSPILTMTIRKQKTRLDMLSTWLGNPK